MQRWSNPRRRRTVPLTPLIDVVFLLLIFFVMAGRFTEESRLVLSGAATAEPSQIAEPPRSMLVQVDRSGGLLLLGQAIEPASLAARRPDDVMVVLRLAPAMSLEVMVEVIDRLKAVGIDELSYWPEPADQ